MVIHADVFELIGFGLIGIVVSGFVLLMVVDKVVSAAKGLIEWFKG